MLYLKIFVCLIVIICFIIYYRRRKEKFLSEYHANLLGGMYEDVLKLEGDLKISNILNSSNNEIVIIIEYNDDTLTEEILKYTYESLNDNDEIINENFQNVIVNNPTMILNGSELIQLTKISPDLTCNNNNDFIMILTQNPINYSEILEIMINITTIFSDVSVENIKFYHQQNRDFGYIYVIIKNYNDIDRLIELYNVYTKNYVDNLPTLICPQSTTTTTQGVDDTNDTGDSNGVGNNSRVRQTLDISGNVLVDNQNVSGENPL